jgi:hypothetical protein
VEELFEVPEEEPERSQWRAWVPRFEYAVDDLTQARAEALMGQGSLPSFWRVPGVSRSDQAARTATAHVLTSVMGTQHEEELMLTFGAELIGPG